MGDLWSDFLTQHTVAKAEHPNNNKDVQINSIRYQSDTFVAELTHDCLYLAHIGEL